MLKTDPNGSIDCHVKQAASRLQHLLRLVEKSASSLSIAAINTPIRLCEGYFWSFKEVCCKCFVIACCLHCSHTSRSPCETDLIVLALVFRQWRHPQLLKYNGAAEKVTASYMIIHPAQQIIKLTFVESDDACRATNSSNFSWFCRNWVEQNQGYEGPFLENLLVTFCRQRMQVLPFRSNNLRMLV